MAIKVKKNLNRKYISGKGYCACHKKQYAHGKDMVDVFRSLVTPAVNFIKDNQDTLKSTAEAIGNVAKIGDSTRTIVQEIMKKRSSNSKNVQDNLKNIVDKINQFKMGSGFAYI